MWDLPDLDPGKDAIAEVYFDPLFIGLDVPGVPSVRTNLQLAYWTGSEHLLQGEWGSSYLLEDQGNSAECLTVRGVGATPAEFARFAADWMLAQLRRPLVREEWLSGDVPRATTWRLTDTGEAVAYDGLSVRRLFRRKPDRVVVVGGKASA